MPGVSETIRVHSIVGRFLEHTRILAFTVGEETRYYIGSADIMVRNLDNRVEAFVPVEDPVAQAELEAILELGRRDTALAWSLSADGTWQKLRPAGGRDRVNTHESLMARAAGRERASAGATGATGN